MQHRKVRSGDGHHNTNIQISSYPDVQMSGYLDIRYDIPDIRYQVSDNICEHCPSFVFPESQAYSTNMANEAMAALTPPEI